MTRALCAPQKEFARLQRDWLDASGSRAQSHYFIFKPQDKQIHALVTGQGEPLLMLHGGNSFSALWEPLFTLLKPDFRLIAPDRFSCGLSEVIDYKKLDLYQHAIEYIDALLDHYNYTSINIIGNSLGGYWALLYALAKPERVKKIILIGTPGGTQAPPAILRFSSIPVLNKILFFILMNAPHSTENLFKRALVADLNHLPKAIFKLMHDGLRLPGAQQAWLDILEMTCTIKNIKPEFYLFDKLQDIQQKTLVLWGDKDVFGNVKQAHNVANALPHSQLEIIKNAAHMPWLDQGEICADLIKNFLNNNPHQS
ncbi:MAG: alpha/beta hydrolase [Legionellales bacterium]|jgi:pimeloyl-ACP methyl ester carboxylesterase